jgi:hypothetical protein
MTPKQGSGPGSVSTEPLQRPAHVNLRYVISRGQEPAALISMREYERLIERIDGCKTGGWADLWLAGAGVGAALAVGAVIAALTVPPALSGTRAMLWALAAAGLAILGLCLAGYLSQRREAAAGISELRKDLDIHLAMSANPQRTTSRPTAAPRSR